MLGGVGSITLSYNGKMFCRYPLWKRRHDFRPPAASGSHSQPSLLALHSTFHLLDHERSYQRFRFCCFWCPCSHLRSRFAKASSLVQYVEQQKKTVPSIRDPLTNAMHLYIDPSSHLAAAVVFGGVGYFMNGVLERQNALIEGKKDILLQHRARAEEIAAKQQAAQ